jgi:hypothetical protein
MIQWSLLDTWTGSELCESHLFVSEMPGKTNGRSCSAAQLWKAHISYSCAACCEGGCITAKCAGIPGV